MPLLITVLPEKLSFTPVRTVVPPPSWLIEPLDPWMEAEIVEALLWLKLRVPVPTPSKIVEAEMVPPASLNPRPPMLRVPDELLW